MKIRLRRFPFPCLAGMAVCNDADFCTPESFENWHSFLNTKKQTNWGRGLGLEIADSFFAYSANDYNYSYFAGCTKKKSRHAGRMEELIRAGYLDTLHTYGDYDFVGGFKREDAQTVVLEFERQNLSVPVWVNHGGKENVQNVGGESAYYQEGDKPDSDAYHADLLERLGVCYVWEDQGGAPEFYMQQGGYRRPWMSFFGKPPRWKPKAEQVELLRLQQLQDGNLIKTFRRYRGADAPVLDVLSKQISQDSLTSLIKKRGVSIVYQHLNIRRRSEGGNLEPLGNSKPDEKALDVFRMIASLVEEGKLFFTTTSRLLRYLEVWEELEAIDNRKEEPVIRLSASRPLGHYMGLCWYCSKPERIRVMHGSKEINVQKNPADDQGWESVSIPWQPMEYPDG